MSSHAKSHVAYDVLPKDLLEIQLGQIDLLMAMYALEDAISLDASTQALADELKDWCSGDLEKPPQISSPNIYMLLTLQIPRSETEDASSGDEVLQLDISVPLVFDPTHDPGSASEPPAVKVRIRQPAWMSKAETSQLTAETPPEDDMFAVIEHVKTAATDHLSRSRQLELTAVARLQRTALGGADESLVRVWFYFPSISTRSKRDDLINNAPGYGLTGFLLAGKPGILCLEGDSQRIDDYMKFIKTESWGDIPPQHKKVSERYRQTGTGVGRVFVDMQEITDLVGERRGERANRGDMRAIESWLNERGLGDALTKVLI